MSLYAALDWQHNEPVSLTFEDVYFSRAEGLAEAQHVFIKHNRLPERFAALTAHDHFTIGELGFGTGLNFLCAWRCFLTHAPASARLHMVSIEKFPLHPADLKQALALWPELARESAALVQHYHTITAGWQRLVFAEGRITLTLAIGDVHDVLPQLDANVDAWFLDGFSPAKNPEMWQASLFHTLATLSSPGSTFATFTSAGEVRRALAASGFHVHKARGLGKKREISHGTLATPPSPPWQAPWFARPQANHDKSVLIIGGGLAGAATAYSLARRAWAVTLIERHPALAHEASGNPQGVVYAKLSAHAPPLTQWLLSGYGYTLRTLAQLFGEDDDYWQRCGVLQLAFNAQEQARQQQLTEAGLPTDLLYALTAEQTNALAGVAINQAALYFPQGAWVTPPAFVNRLSTHPAIRLCLSSAVCRLVWEEALQRWVAYGASGPLASASSVVIAAATASTHFDHTRHLPLKGIRGQITSVPATPLSSQLNTILCGKGYILPAHRGHHCLGATFKFHTSDVEVDDAEHGENLAMLQQMAPALYHALAGPHTEPRVSAGRAALRCTSPDYLPLIGPIVDPSDFTAAWRALGHNAHLALKTPAPWLPNLYVNTAHGTRGLVSAPLSGELIAAYLNDEPSPIARALREAVHPNRFLWRDLTRGKLR